MTDPVQDGVHHPGVVIEPQYVLEVSGRVIGQQEVLDRAPYLGSGLGVEIDLAAEQPSKCVPDHLRRLHVRGRPGVASNVVEMHVDHGGQLAKLLWRCGKAEPTESALLIGAQQILQVDCRFNALSHRPSMEHRPDEYESPAKSWPPLGSQPTLEVAWPPMRPRLDRPQ